MWVGRREVKRSSTGEKKQYRRQKHRVESVIRLCGKFTFIAQTAFSVEYKNYLYNVIKIKSVLYF